MRIAVLFDGAGLARLGLEQAGHDCTGYELDPAQWDRVLYEAIGNGVPVYMSLGFGKVYSGVMEAIA